MSHEKEILPATGRRGVLNRHLQWLLAESERQLETALTVDELNEYQRQKTAAILRARKSYDSTRLKTTLQNR